MAINLGLSPEFFDIFGLAVFSYLVFVGIFMLMKRKGYKKDKWFYIAISLIIIGILGLVVDGGNVFNKFVLQNFI